MAKHTIASPTPKRQSARLKAKVVRQQKARLLARPEQQTRQGLEHKRTPRASSPTKRARARRQKMISEQDIRAAEEHARRHMLDVYTRGLLPCSWFGVADALWVRGVWGFAQESALRDEMEASPQYGRLVQQQAQFYAKQDPTGAYVKAELQLADILQHRFRCYLDDLFRYGLRPGLRGSPGQEIPKHPYATKDYLTKLACILTHPMWNGIAAVRWLLQRVVQERVPGHARPLVPPYSFWKRPFVATARQWATHGGSSGTKGDAAEAELTWFLFAAGMPRDLWQLERLLKHVDEPGYGQASGDDSGDDDESDDASVARGGSAGSNESRLSVCSAIKTGRFGRLSGSFAGCEVTQRQERLRRQDRWRARCARTQQDAGGVAPADLTDEQVFFDLQEQDLDRVLGLLADKHFMANSGSAAPECYYAGYIKAHDVLGYGSEGRQVADGGPEPLLTCYVCAKKYHQGKSKGEGSAADGHGYAHAHFQHQRFVRGDPERMVAWLQQRKAEWLAAGMREARINAVLRGGNCGSGINRLPDVPPFDPVPMGHLDRVFTHPSQLEVLERASRGDRPHASVLWCLGGQWEEEEE